ncbi:MAG TPA: ATP-binding protein [Rummeliibacillus sp.]|nr:ATP-binding protein [Rummeliibacillus sp.]
MKRKLFITGCIMIFLFTIISSFNYFNIFEPKGPDAKNGVLDLSHWDFEKNGNVNLDGEWQFYGGDLITPDKNLHTFNEYTHKLTTIHVPGNWNDQKNCKFGTYRLLIKLPKNGTYGVKTDTIRNSSRLFMNGIESEEKGNPTKHMGKYQYSDEKYVAYSISKNNEMEIVMQVASPDYPVVGIVKSIKFGEEEKIATSKTIDILFDTALFSGYFLLFIMYFVTFLQRRRNLYELYFSLFCLFQGFYISSLNQQLLFIGTPEMPSLHRAYFQLSFFHLTLLFFLLFIYDFYKPYVNKLIVKILCSLIVMQELVEGVPSPIMWIHLPIMVEKICMVIIIVFSYGYIFYVLLKVLVKKVEGSEYILFIVTSFGCYGLLIELHFLFETHINNEPLLLFLIMVIGMSSLIGFRHQHAFTEVDRLSKELIFMDEMKDEFLMKSSHELRTPLNGIINISEFLIEGNNGVLKKEQLEAIISIHSVGRRLERVVEDLLYAGKMKSEDIHLIPSPVNIYVVEEIIKELSYLIPSKHNVDFINKVPANLPLVYVDESKLKQVFFNLIYNAIKFTTYGAITVSAKVKSEEMRISVEDTGEGIAKENLDKVFSSLYQVHGRESEGLGLGLSITKQIVEASGGHIWVSSEVGKGSIFTFTIPLANTNQLKEVIKVEYAASIEPDGKMMIEQFSNQSQFLDLPLKIKGKKPYTILVIDDDHTNLKVMINCIRSMDYTVIAVDNGEKAIQIIKDEPIDLIVLDLMMPTMSGLEVCKIVRQDYDLTELPIIILTAAGQLTDLVVSFKGGANDFLQKPVNMEELKVRIDSLLLIKESSQEAIKNELNFLSTQITPHFLYNTFNTIIGLSYKDQEKTREALQYLSIYFRAKLDYKGQNSLIPLENEIELVQAYLEIEKLRFGDRLHIEYDIDENIEAVIPSMTIQPLVENAVHHGIVSKQGGGTVKVAIKKVDEGIKIIVEDNGVGIPIQKQEELLNERGTRIGFSNPFRKLKLIKKATFSLESTEGKGTRITIILPEVGYDESLIN